MSRWHIMKLVIIPLLLCFFPNLDLYAQSSSENFRSFSAVLDGFGGRAESDSFLLRIASGGQLVVGISEDASFLALQGYVHAAAFVHADCDGNGKVELADVVYLINYVLKGGPEPKPYESGDMDCPNNIVDLADVVYLINYLFRGGPPPCNL